MRKTRTSKFARVLDRDRTLGFNRARSQARFRGEPWTLTLEDWVKLWPDERWVERGRETYDLVMTREDLDGAWSLDNILIITRDQQLKRKEQYTRHRKLRDLK